VIRALTKLKDEYDITVQFGTVEDDDGADFDPLQRTLTINHRIDVGDMAFLFRDFWNYLTIGPHGSLARELPCPVLYLVPAPQTELDEATA
jgi:hypothetical protein